MKRSYYAVTEIKVEPAISQIHEIETPTVRRMSPTVAVQFAALPSEKKARLHSGKEYSSQ